MVSDSIPNPTGSPNTWKADVLDPWVNAIADAYNAHAANTGIHGGSSNLPVKNLIDHYGVNPSGSAASQTTAINAAMADHATWSVLQVPDMFSINGPINESVMYAKIIEGFSREDTGFEQTGNNMAIVRTATTLAHSTIWRNLMLTYSTQQTFASHPNSSCFEIRATTAGDQSQWWRRWQNLRLHGGTYGINTNATLGSASPWGSVWEDILMSGIGHTAFRIAPNTGTPTVYVRNLQVSNAGVTPTGPAMELVGVEGYFEVDIEHWTNTIVDANGGCTLIFMLPHLENNVMTGVNTQLFLLQNEGSTTIIGGNLAVDDVDNTGQAAWFNLGNDHKLMVIGAGYGLITMTAGYAVFAAGDGTGVVRLKNVKPITGAAATSSIWFPALTADALSVAQIREIDEWSKPPMRTVTANTTASHSTDGLGTIFVDATAGVRTITLPPAAERPGNTITITRTNSAANNVVVDGDAAELINSSATATLTAQWSSITVQSYGTGWAIIAAAP